MTRALYITRNGLLEPLGQSQILAYLRGLAADHSITLISFEKDEDWANSADVSRVREECGVLGINWMPQRFRQKPRLVAPALSMALMLRLSISEIRRCDVGLIHARSYVPAAVALVARRITGVPFIFDMRALWPEELITAGRLRRGSLLHKSITQVERLCLQRAAAVVSLTEAAVDHLKATYPEALYQQRVAVIPTCADLERFTPSDSRPSSPVYSCIGTLLSGWFRVDWLKQWIDTVVAREPGAQFEIVTRESALAVREAIDPDGELHECLNITSQPPARMPDTLKSHSASVMFFTDGLSKLGSSPTRMGEILGTGIPVVVNDGVGDVARIVADNRVGVIVASDSTDDMAEAWDDLQALMQDPELAARCRATAEAVFSLSSGTECYRELYYGIIARSEG